MRDTHLLSLLDGLRVDGRLFTGNPGDVGRAAIENGSRMRAEDTLIILGGLLVLVSVISLISWLRKLRLRPGAGRVFSQQARAMGLTRADRKLLCRISRAVSLPNPITLLLTPGTLGRCARDYARRQTRRRGTLDLARAASIRRYLFGPPELGAG